MKTKILKQKNKTATDAKGIHEKSRAIQKAITLLLMTATIFFAGFNQNYCFAEDFLQNDQNEIVKQACLKATITAIKMEIGRCERWIGQGPDADDVPILKGELAKLQADLGKYQKMEKHDYKLPSKTVTEAWVGETAQDGSILYVHPMMKSEPMYILSGIVGDGYSVLQPDVRRIVTFYPVYQMSYWHMTGKYWHMTIKYICVGEVE